MPNSLPVNSEKPSTYAGACGPLSLETSSKRGFHYILDSLIERGADLYVEESWPSKMDQDAASACLLHVCGITLAPKTLQKRRVVGGSPPFQKYGTRVVYPRDLLVAWGHAQAGPVVNSTAELAAN
jgi:hypothetical protein